MPHTDVLLLPETLVTRGQSLVSVEERQVFTIAGRNEDVRASEQSSAAPGGCTALLRSVRGCEGGFRLRVRGAAGGGQGFSGRRVAPPRRPSSLSSWLLINSRLLAPIPRQPFLAFPFIIFIFVPLSSMTPAFRPPISSASPLRLPSLPLAGSGGQSAPQLASHCINYHDLKVNWAFPQRLFSPLWSPASLL